MVNLILLIVISIIIISSSLYVYKAKKRGQKCIGCPYAKKCSENGEHKCGTKL